MGQWPKFLKREGRKNFPETRSWPQFLKREGRKTFPETRSCIFLCKNLIKRDVRRLLYRQGARMTNSRRLHYSQGANSSQVAL